MYRLLVLPLLLLSLGCVMPVHAEPAVKTELRQTDQGWQLIRDGKPYAIKGAGGHQYLELLKASGGNSIRTWGVDEGTQALLDEAHKHGLTVTLGIWLGHERHGFDYTDLDQVAKQLAHVREAVETYKDHPALLAWGVGNEMEGFAEGDNAAIWSHVEACAALIKRLDPNHPTITVIAEIGGKKVEAIHRLCPSIDIVGINSYGGGQSLPKRYAKAGGTKPYVVTEFGPPGAWEVGGNDFGVPEELSSSAKAGVYATVYKALREDEGRCLGSYAFLWGSKVEATTTWFGMFLPDGSKLAPVDAMTKAWSGKAPKNLCPTIASFSVKGNYKKEPDAAVSIELEAVDPEGKPLDVSWSLMLDPMSYATGGDKVDAPPTYPDRILSSSGKGCELRLPDKGGVYRVYVVVKDPAGNAAVANLALSAGPDEDAQAANNLSKKMTPGKPVQLPYTVYSEAGGASPWIASGYMGNAGQVKMDPNSTEDPKAGKTCLQVRYLAADKWAGVVWQDPADDWGDRAGGYDLRGATAVEFWARGEEGGEVVEFGFGVLGSDKPYADSGSGKLKAVRLTDEWRKYRIEIGSDVDLQRIKTGFYWTLAGQGDPLTFYLDEIRYVKDEKD